LDANYHEGKEELPFQSEGIRAGSWKEDRTPQDWGIAPDAAMENDELGNMLLHCMSILPEKWRAVFSLRVVDELDTETVCKELDITSSNLWVILHRAKLQLRECVERNWFTD